MKNIIDLQFWSYISSVTFQGTHGQTYVENDQISKFKKIIQEC
jgi:hypothetical protein